MILKLKKKPFTKILLKPHIAELLQKNQETRGWLKMDRKETSLSCPFPYPLKYLITTEKMHMLEIMQISHSNFSVLDMHD